MVRLVRRVAVAGLMGFPVVATAQQPAPPPPPPPAPTTQVTVSGVLYAQFAYALTDPNNAGHLNNFDVTRAYLNFIGRFAEGVGIRATGDVYRNTDGSLAYRLKYGYANWTPKGSALTYKFGMMQTPFVEYVENLWDYRMQGQDAVERAGYLSSSDFGVGTDGTWNGDQVTMQAGVYNGEFYSRAPGDKHKDIAARLSVRMVQSDDASRFGGLRLTGFALYGTPTGGGKRQRYLGQLSFRSKRFLLAGHFMTTKDRVDPAPATPPVPIPPTTSGRVASIMSTIKFPPKFALIGRFDIHDRDTDTPNDRLTRVIAGASYQLNSNLRLLADLDHTTYQGSAPTPALDAVRSQALFQIQLQF